MKIIHKNKQATNGYSKQIIFYDLKIFECLLIILYDIGCNLYMLIAIDLNPRPVSNEFYALMRTLLRFGSIWTFFKAMIFYK